MSNILVRVALPVLLVGAGCVSTRAPQPADLYRQARATLAQVENAPDLIETVHADPRVLAAIGTFLHAADAENMSDERACREFRQVVPVPPWEWSPVVDFRRVGPARYLVAVGHAVAGRPSSLYLFDGSRHVKIDSGVSGTVQVERVDVQGDRMEIVYFPAPSGGAPRLKSAVVERTARGWRVDHDTPYQRVTALLTRVPREQIDDPAVHRNPVLLEALGVFLEHAGRLDRGDLSRHMSALFADQWYKAWPRLHIERVGPTRYLVTLERATPVTSGSSLYFFDGAGYVRLASDDARSIHVDGFDAAGDRLEVRYRRSALHDPRATGTAVAEKDGGVWRVRPPGP